MQSTRPEIYFLHIPKTAGTSLGGMIRSAYPKDEAIPGFRWQHLMKMQPATINRYRCYTGHFGTSLFSILNREVPTVTILRDPFERAISSIKYMQNQAVITRKISPSVYLWLAETFYASKALDGTKRTFVNCSLQDLQTRYLGIDIDLNPYFADPERNFDNLHYELLLYDELTTTTMDAVLERAKRRLDSMAIVGTVERFAESAELIFNYLGVPMPEKLRQENISRGHVVGESHRKSCGISSKLTERIDAITQYDRQLYDYANQLLDRQLASRHLK